MRDALNNSLPNTLAFRPINLLTTWLHHLITSLPQDLPKPRPPILLNFLTSWHPKFLFPDILTSWTLWYILRCKIYRRKYSRTAQNWIRETIKYCKKENYIVKQKQKASVICCIWKFIETHLTCPPESPPAPPPPDHDHSDLRDLPGGRHRLREVGISPPVRASSWLIKCHKSSL